LHGFLAEQSEQSGQPIHTIQSDKYSCVADILWKDWINSVHCAACSWYKECELKELSMIIDKQ